VQQSGKKSAPHKKKRRRLRIWRNIDRAGIYTRGSVGATFGRLRVGTIVFPATAGRPYGTKAKRIE